MCLAQESSPKRFSSSVKREQTQWVWIWFKKSQNRKRVNSSAGAERIFSCSIYDRRRIQIQSLYSCSYAIKHQTRLFFHVKYTAKRNQMCVWHYSVSGEHLRPVLVDDLDDAGRLDPGLSVHLHRDSLLPQDGDLHLAALRRSRAENSSCQTRPLLLFLPAMHRELSPAWPPPSSAARRRAFYVILSRTHLRRYISVLHLMTWSVCAR